MASRRLTDLVPEAYERAEAAAVAWERAGLTVLVTCTYRTPEEQGALYAQGRLPLGAVNAAREAVGLSAIGENENRHKITNAAPGMSWHNWQRAFDVVPLVAGKCVWNASASIWQDVGRIGEGCGLEWAARWKRFKEFPHFQFTAGMSIYNISGSTE